MDLLPWGPTTVDITVVTISSICIFVSGSVCVRERERQWKALMHRRFQIWDVCLYLYVCIIGCKSGSRLCNNCCCLKYLNHSQLDNKEQSCSIFKQSLNWPCLLTFTSPSSLSVWSNMTVNCAPLRAPLEQMKRFSFCSSTKPSNYICLDIKKFCKQMCVLVMLKCSCVCQRDSLFLLF